MASTAETNTKIELIGTGDQAGTWGTALNTALKILARVSTGYNSALAISTSTTVSVSDYTLGDWHYVLWNLTGTLGANSTLTVPNLNKLWFVLNSTTGSYTLTVKVSGQTGVVVNQGDFALLYNNGTDVKKVTWPIEDLDIVGGTAETTPVAGDSVALYDLSATANRKVTLANLNKGLALPFCNVTAVSWSVANATLDQLVNGDVVVDEDLSTMWDTVNDRINIPSGYTRVRIHWVVLLIGPSNACIAAVRKDTFAAGGSTNPPATWFCTEGNELSYGNEVAAIVTFEDECIGGTTYYKFFCQHAEGGSSDMTAEIFVEVLL